MGIFHDFFARNYLSISIITWKIALSLKLPIKEFFFFNTVHNLITFSIVFTNKNRGGTLSPPPIITKVYKPPIITKVKAKNNTAPAPQRYYYHTQPRLTLAGSWIRIQCWLNLLIIYGYKRSCIKITKKHGSGSTTFLLWHTAQSDLGMEEDISVAY